MADPFSTSAIGTFHIWREGYAAAVVEILKPNTDILIPVFSDPQLTIPAANPQTLLSDSVDGRLYGKFATTLYTAGSYQLRVNATDRTPVINPGLASLLGANASSAVSQSRRSSRTVTLKDRFGRDIHVEDFGALSATNAAENTTTLTAAIGSAAGDGGGRVRVPAGTWPFNNLTLPSGVVLEGAGEEATVLQSTFGARVITIGGAHAGLKDLTLDGVNLTDGSIGLYALSADHVILEWVVVKRFETGVQFKGGRGNQWVHLSVVNCENGADLIGDVGLTEGSAGDKWEFNQWIGGDVAECTTFGLRLSYFDQSCFHNALYGLDFVDNTGIALQLEGARSTIGVNCSWEGNVVNLDVRDDSDLGQRPDNLMVGLLLLGGYMNGGDLDFDGNCEDIVLQRMDLIGVTFNLDLPEREILLLDCQEDATNTVTGDRTKLVRNRSGGTFEVTGVTTDANWLTAFDRLIEHGQVVYLEAKISANRRDGIEYGVWHVSMAARRPPAQLSFDNQTANFTVGVIVTGQNSGATARVVAQTDAGSTGVLQLRDVSGDFADNEIIEDTGGGSAQVNGVLVGQNAVLSVSASLAYDGQAANFTVGQVVTGGTSGSKGTITADADGGAAGTLTIRDISGPGFLDNEAITDPLGGSALVNIPTAGLTLASLVENIRVAFKTHAAYNVRFAVSGGSAQVQVLGDTSHTVEWTVQISELLE